MFKDIKDKWVCALMSDDYKQGKGFLRNGDEFCCLGVLTDIYLKEHDLEWETSDTDQNYMAFDGSFETLSQKVTDWSGLDDRNPYVITKDFKAFLLSERNDKGASFKEIGQIIKENL